MKSYEYFFVITFNPFGVEDMFQFVPLISSRAIYIKARRASVLIAGISNL
jgi:hypothetical protein